MEFALVLPLLLLVVLGVVQVGLVVRDELVLVGAARAGAREAVVTADDEQVRQVVYGSAPGLDAASVDIAVTRTGRGAPASVSLTYAERLSVPFVDWLFPSSMTLHAAASMRQEFG